MTVWRTATRVAWLLAACGAGSGSTAGAQTLPSEPITLADGRVTVGADVSATFGSSDRGSSITPTTNTPRYACCASIVSAAAKAGPHFTLLGELRSENVDSVRPYALYLRIKAVDGPRLRHPDRHCASDLRRIHAAHVRQRQPAHRVSSRVSVPHDAASRLDPGDCGRAPAEARPRMAHEILRRRQRVEYWRAAGQRLPLGHGCPSPWHGGIVTATAAVTAGTVSNPRFTDDNSGPQVAGRVELRPVTGLLVATSLARGPFVSTRPLAAQSGTVTTPRSRKPRGALTSSIRAPTT